MFPPSLLANISSEAIQMVKPHHPDYALALNHVLDYYDLPLVTFGRDHKDRLVVCFPIFIKEYHKQPLSLYQIETDSYSQVLIHKKIRFTYFCEELFLSKHSTHKSCAIACSSTGLMKKLKLLVPLSISTIELSLLVYLMEGLKLF